MGSVKVVAITELYLRNSVFEYLWALREKIFKKTCDMRIVSDFYRLKNSLGRLDSALSMLFLSRDLDDWQVLL